MKNSKFSDHMWLFRVLSVAAGLTIVKDYIDVMIDLDHVICKA